MSAVWPETLLHWHIYFLSWRQSISTVLDILKVIQHIECFCVCERLQWELNL